MGKSSLHLHLLPLSPALRTWPVGGREGGKGKGGGMSLLKWLSVVVVSFLGEREREREREREICEEFPLSNNLRGM